MSFDGFVMMAAGSHIEDVECAVCHDAKPVYIPFIKCPHSNFFCEQCIKQCLEQKDTCPYCRAYIPIRDYLRTTNQRNVNIADVSFAFEYQPRPPLPTLPPLSSNRSIHYILTCCSIGLLLDLIIHPTIFRA